jgi:FkbM family methyltransferase
MTGWTVIDIGAHIGAFANACLERGAKAKAFEPFPENYKLLLKNLNAPNENAKAFSYAIWRSDIDTPHLETLTISDYNHDEEPPNTGSPSIIFGGHFVEEVYCLPFDDLFFLDRQVDLVKLDCEGAEWPILFTSKKLHLIDRIIGEYHECRLPFDIDGKNEFTVEDLVKLLEDNGFEVEHFRHDDSHLGMFFAKRRGL